ncbi:hypothetical protein A3759_06280 [Thalassolituus sp. HI0120]|nr:hypothetical protein A3759_06280 [Thalassolituus sp. HI0120]
MAKSGSVSAKHIDTQRAFAAHIRAPHKHPIPADIDPRRMKIYSDLFFNNVSGFLDGTFPVCAEIIGAKRWNEIARDFFESHFCQTPYFLEIPQEFLAYLEQEFRAHPDDPDYLYELAHYEWLELAIDVSEDEVSVDIDANADLSSTVPLFAAAAQGFVYQYPVHRISVENIHPEPHQTALIVFRDRQDQVRFIETNLMTIHLLIKLKSAELTGLQAVEQLLLENDLERSPVALQGGLSILEEWRQQGLILGGSVV